MERRSPDGASRGAVLIAPAMATKASFYAPLATWLATQGFTAYTFDYQGHGRSARTPLREVQADFLTWARDAATVAAWVREDAPGLSVTWLGHSLGGQLLGFAPRDALDRAIIVGSGTGYWRNAEGRDRILAPLLWYVVEPIATRLFGYFPGRRVKLLGDIPGPVIRQWAGWCRHPGYLLGALPEHRKAFAGVRVPITSVSFTDDATMSAIATAQLEEYYAGAPLTRLRYDPTDLGQARIGHMGFFYRDREALWEQVLPPLLAAPSETQRLSPAD